MVVERCSLPLSLVKQIVARDWKCRRRRETDDHHEERGMLEGQEN